MEEAFNPTAPAMMPENREIKAAAKAMLSGRWTNPVICTLLYVAITAALSLLPSALSAAASLLVTVPLGFGYCVAFLLHVRGKDDEELITRPFLAFKQYSRYLGTSLLVTVFVMLWCLLLIIPGIIMGYAYEMTPFIMHDNPEMSAMDCIRKSKEMMRGYKWKLFCMDLSFIGWLLLCILTLGVLTLWVTPWMQCSHAKFYEELKARPQQPAAARLD